jgi:hypothetical protein
MKGWKMNEVRFIFFCILLIAINFIFQKKMKKLFRMKKIFEIKYWRWKKFITFQRGKQCLLKIIFVCVCHVGDDNTFYKIKEAQIVIIEKQ